MEKDARTRLISTLARQLERHRDVMPYWAEQQGALRVVVDRVDKELHKRSSDIAQLLLEREQIEKLYDEKYDGLVRCLSQEQEKATASAQAKKRELVRSIELEDKTTKELVAEEQTLEQLELTFDQTRAHLELVVQQLQDSQDSAEKRALQAPPDLDVARVKIEALMREKECSLSERQSTEIEIQKVAADLELQRDHAAKLEDFIQRLLQGSSGYILDSSMKKEASSILAAAAKLQRPSNLRESSRSVEQRGRLVTAP